MRPTFLLLAALSLVAATLPACAEYKIMVEDQLKLDVWGEEQLSGLHLVVAPDGNVNVPIVGVIKAEGMTADELAKKIADGLVEKKWLRKPHVQISIMQLHQPNVSVLGNVNRPGQFLYKDGDTVMQAIAQAGSYREDADLANATLTRKTGERISLDLYKLYYKGDITQNLALKNGDTITIPENTTQRIYVLGEVQRPGQYVLKENMTALSAISLAGGPIPDRGKLKGTMVIRGDPANPQRIKLDISKMIATGDRRQDVPLQPGDLVYVPKTSKPSLQDLSQILGALTNFRWLTQGLAGR